MPITNLSDQLKRDEGWRSKPYADTVGKMTIGYGRNLSDVGVSQSEGDVMLDNDITTATITLEKQFPWTASLDEVRRGALLNMTFNMGIGGLAQFKQMLAKLQAGDYQGAAAEMLDSQWAQQVSARAQRLSVQIQTGEWQ